MYWSSNSLLCFYLLCKMYSVNATDSLNGVRAYRNLFIILKRINILGSHSVKPYESDNLGKLHTIAPNNRNCHWLLQVATRVMANTRVSFLTFTWCLLWLGKWLQWCMKQRIYNNNLFLLSPHWFRYFLGNANIMKLLLAVRGLGGGQECDTRTSLRPSNLEAPVHN